MCLRITFHARRPPASALAGCGYGGTAWSVKARSLRATPFSCLTFHAVAPSPLRLPVSLLRALAHPHLACPTCSNLRDLCHLPRLHDKGSASRLRSLYSTTWGYEITLYSQDSEAGATRSERVASILRLMAILVWR